MVEALRTRLISLVKQSDVTPENAGLALDRYMPETGEKQQESGSVFNRVCAVPPPAIYRAAYERWLAYLGQFPQIITRRFRVQSRLIVGLGGESVHETSISLQRIYGVPYIPGSALKGLARRYAQAATAGDSAHPLASKGVDHRALFGDQDSAAYLTYFDAWYIPASAPEDRLLARDVMTVHHPDYYGKRGDASPPWDFDDPIPVPFLSARGEYLIAVRGPSDAWSQAAMSILERALAEWGVGAKTSSGYGRLVPAEAREPAAAVAMSTVETEPDQTPPAGTPAADATPMPDAEALIQEVRTMRPARVRQEIHSSYLKWQKLEGPAKRALAEAILQRLEEVKVLREWNAKPWVRELQDSLSASQE